MGALSTRRAFLASSLSVPLLAAKGQTFPAERVRFADGATELDVLRLTDPEFTSILPPPHSRAASSRGGFLVYASDRTGSMQVCRMDIRAGDSRVLTEAVHLDPDSVTMLPDEKSVCYFDGPSLNMVNIGNQKDREVYRCGNGSVFAPGLSIGEDGLQAAFIVRDKTRFALMVAALAKGGEQKIADLPPAAELPMLRPKRAAVLYRTPDGLWLTSLDATENRKLKTAPGRIGEAMWAPDGRTLLYMSGNELREHTPDSNTDAAVAKTSQFASFGRNSDASVFVGASHSKAGPYVLLLLRISRREMALCEHRCSDPTRVHPVFSPSSQRIYFQSDRSGKMAIYTMSIERLVEKTET